MKSVSLFNRTAMATALVFTGVMGSFGVASAEDTAPWTDMDFQPDAFESQVSDYNIEITGNDYEIISAAESEYQGGQGETIVIQGDTANIGVYIYEDDYSAQEDIELDVETLSDYENVEEVDSEYTDEGGWALYVVTDEQELGDSAAYYYATVQTDVDGDIDVMQWIFSMDADFTDNVEAAQDSIAIGDMDFMEDVDAAEVQDVADEAADSMSSPSNNQNDNQDDTEEDATPQTGR